MAASKSASPQKSEEESPLERNGNGTRQDTVMPKLVADIAQLDPAKLSSAANAFRTFLLQQQQQPKQKTEGVKEEAEEKPDEKVERG